MTERNKLAVLLQSTAQGANNNIAGNVAIPVDYIAQLLRAAGVQVPVDPVMGTSWQQQQGLIAQPENRLAGLLGEQIGTVAPMGLKRPPALVYP